MPGVIPKPLNPTLKGDLSMSANLVSAYVFNQKYGATVSNLIGNKNDIDIVTGTTWQNGRYGSTLNFGGADYGNIVDFMTYLNGDDWTLNMQYTPSAPADYEYIVGSSTTASKFDFLTGATNFLWRITDAIRFYAYTFVAGVTYNVTAIKTGSGDSGDLYINGVYQTPTSGTIGSTTTSGSVNVGTRATAASQFFNGDMDSIMLFDGRLTEADVQLLYHDPFVLYRNDDITDWIGGTITSGVFAPYYYEKLMQGQV